METNVGILAIGNEVVEGQITNSNGAWLASELLTLGTQPLLHASCRDKDDEIAACLNFLAPRCHLIIVSGGLGPTRDDCTRQSLSAWSGSPLEFIEAEWSLIKSKLDGRVTLREGHKKQAYIPREAIILKNDEGVAPGFFLKAGPCFLASLPGPAAELQCMYSEYLRPLILTNLAPRQQQILRTWICLGAPESEVAHIAEAIIGDEFEIGFRLHKPFVEVKVWTPMDLIPSQEKRLKAMAEKLKPWLVGTSIKGIRRDFHGFLSQYDKVYVIDHLTSGLFLEKLGEDYISDHLRYQCFEHKAFRYFSEKEVREIIEHMRTEPAKNELFISLFPKSEDSVLISFNGSIECVKLPARMPVRSKLGQLYAIEKCFLKNSNFP